MIRKYIFICLVTLFAFSKPAHSQSDFKNMYTQPTLRCQREMLNGDYMLLYSNFLTFADNVGTPINSLEFIQGGVPLGMNIQLRCIQQTADAGFIMTGTYTGANDDVVLIKTNNAGVVTWSKSYGGLGSDHGIWVEQTADGGYIISGTKDEITPGRFTEGSFYIIKTDINGVVQWDKALDIGGIGSTQNIKQTSDGGYILTGNTAPEDMIGNLYMMKLDNAGGITWQFEYSLNCNSGIASSGREVWEIPGGYIVAGYVGGDVFPLKSKALLMKVDLNGAILDIGAFEFMPGGGGPTDLGFVSMDVTSTGEFVGSGGGYNDFGPLYILKADANLDMVWSRTYWSFAFSSATSVREDSDGGFNFIDGTSVLLKTTNQGMIHCEVPNAVFQSLANGVTAPLITNAQPSGVTTVLNIQTQAAVININVICAPIIINLVTNSTNVSCFGGNDGTADVVANGGTAPYTYDWQPGGQVTPVANNLIAGIYTVTVTDNTGATATSTVTITEPAAALNVSINPVNPICAGGNVDLISVVNGGTPAYTYAWSTGAVTPNINVSPLVTTNYILDVTDNNGCQASANIDVIVNPLPPANATNTGPYCNGATIQLNGFGGGSYSWTGPNAFASILQDPTIPVATAVNAGTYTVTVTDGNSCTASATTDVIVAANLVVAAASNSPVCDGQSLDLTSTFIAGATYQWDGPAAYSNATQNPSINPAAVINSGIYTVTITDPTSCSGTATVDVIINPLPIPAASNTGAYCVGDIIQLDALGGTSYSWVGPLGFASGIQNPTISPAAIGMAGIYTVTATANNCSATATTEVFVNPLPVVSFISDITTGCESACATFTNTTPNTQSLQWNFGDGSPNSILDPVTHCFNNPGNYTITLDITDNNQCSNTLAANNYMTINPNPVAAFTSNPQNPTIADPTVNFVDMSQNAVSWDWLFGDPNGTTSNQQNPSFTYTDTGTYQVQLVVTNGFGCTDTVINPVTIYGEFSIFIPNTFTPNEDEMNQIFKPYGRGIADYRFEIFDRWGELIFTSTDLSVGWNGKPTNSGRVAPQGVYVYKINLTDVLGEDHQFIGQVNLIR